MSQSPLQLGNFLHGLVVEGYKGPEVLVSINGSYHRAKITFEELLTPHELVSCSCMFEATDRSCAGGMGLHELPTFLKRNNISLVDLLFKNENDHWRSFDYFTRWFERNLENQRKHPGYRQGRIDALKLLISQLQPSRDPFYVMLGMFLKSQLPLFEELLHLAVR